MSALQADFLYQISKMFLIMAAGWLAVKIKLVPASAGKGISQLAAFIVKPFAIFYAFQVEFSVAQLQGLLLAVGAAVLTHGVFILLARVTGKGLLHMTPEERACVIYTNSGNLLMPLVLAVMGQQWLFYTCAYMAVLQCFVWTHGRSLVCQSHGIQWKKALLNVNILVTLFSLGCFCCRLIVHGILADAVESIADTQGAVNMISLGISFAALKNLNWKKLARVLGVAVQRLVVYPAVILGVFILTGLPHVLPWS